METGREVFSRTMKGEPLSRPAYVPLVETIAGRLSGVSNRNLQSDPTLWANALAGTVAFLQPDGIVVGFDITLAAEACGCPTLWRDDQPVLEGIPSSLHPEPEKNGRLRSALETAGRVFELTRRGRPCFAAITGPLTLACQLFGDEDGPKRLGEVKPLLVRAVEAWSRLRPDVLLFMEACSPAESLIEPPCRRIYTTLRNIVSHYNIAPGLYLGDRRFAALGGLPALDMEIYMLGDSVQGGLASLSSLWEFGEGSAVLGVGLPLDSLDSAREAVHRTLEEHDKLQRRRNFFFTSLGPVSRDVDLELLRGITREISELRL